MNPKVFLFLPSLQRRKWMCPRLSGGRLGVAFMVKISLTSKLENGDQIKSQQDQREKDFLAKGI
jgi:hypothetical protein